MLSAYQAQAYGIGTSQKSSGPGIEEAKAAFAKDKSSGGQDDQNDEFEDWAVLKRCRGHRGSK